MKIASQIGQDTGRWTVAFVGCGDNVFEVARKMDIPKGNTMAYTAEVQQIMSITDGAGLICDDATRVQTSLICHANKRGHSE